MLVPYLHTRLRAHALSQAWPDAPSADRRRKAWELLTRLESLHSTLTLLNFVAFLWDGRHVISRYWYTPSSHYSYSQVPNFGR